MDLVDVIMYVCMMTSMWGYGMRDKKKVAWDEGKDRR